MGESAAVLLLRTFEATSASSKNLRRAVRPARRLHDRACLSVPRKSRIGIDLEDAAVSGKVPFGMDRGTIVAAHDMRKQLPPLNRPVLMMPTRHLLQL
jgi:hypothetical protein